MFLAPRSVERFCARGNHRRERRLSLVLHEICINIASRLGTLASRSPYGTPMEVERRISHTNSRKFSVCCPNTEPLGDKTDESQPARGKVEVVLHVHSTALVRYLRLFLHEIIFRHPRERGDSLLNEILVRSRRDSPTILSHPPADGPLLSQGSLNKFF